MTDPLLGTIILFAGNFAPRGWAFCDGQLLDISSHTALFSLLGTNYGGDGRTTFALPDLRGRTPLHPGQGNGLERYQLGQRGGTESVTLTGAQMPSHNHQVACTAELGNQDSPTGHIPAAERARRTSIWSDGAATGTMGNNMVEASGGGAAHENRAPYLALNYIIAMEGVFPSRS